MSKPGKMLTKTIRFKLGSLKKHFLESIEAEHQNLNASRFTWECKEENEYILFHLKAEDQSAMRAAENSVRKLYRVFESMSEI